MAIEWFLVTVIYFFGMGFLGSLVLHTLRLTGFASSALGASSSAAGAGAGGGGGMLAGLADLVQMMGSWEADSSLSVAAGGLGMMTTLEGVSFFMTYVRLVS